VRIFTTAEGISQRAKAWISQEYCVNFLSYLRRRHKISTRSSVINATQAEVLTASKKRECWFSPLISVTSVADYLLPAPNRSLPVFINPLGAEVTSPLSNCISNGDHSIGQSISFQCLLSDNWPKWAKERAVELEGLHKKGSLAVKERKPTLVKQTSYFLSC
jgi:hypothetical protein